MSKDPKLFSRRGFIQKSGLVTAGIPLMPMANSLPLASPNKSNLKVHLFSKHLQFLNYFDMSEAAADMGFDGLDLTVRPHGHVQPDQVIEKLPKAVEAMLNMGLQPDLLTTNILDAQRDTDVTLLQTASQLGFKHYRMGWFKYEEEKPIPLQIKELTDRFSKLEKFNARLGLKGSYQNHAGKYVGAPIWDTYQIIKDFTSRHIGSQYDIRHAVVEGGSSWELGLKLIKNHINTIAIKDFKWGQVNGVWKPINTPLGEGMVDFKRYFTLLKKYGIQVPVSLHLEYDLGGAEHGMSKISIDRKEIFKQMKKDLTYLKMTWEQAG
ncbi:sugar phosphate isomerase/epimerase [Pseudozobellia sp. WGM2]|uniref:sugar phosphate isomerase/epimerase family protein n=1 Tax=Pseudozobellia sp. WGM2 TaxID=2787625 RepID=UPI001AE0A175|nr:TIM barrel protein [Pseudozobellia sp. WGM2]